MSMKLPHSPLILPVGLFSLGAIISFYFPFYSIKWSFFGFGILFFDCSFSVHKILLSQTFQNHFNLWGVFNDWVSVFLKLLFGIA